MMLARVLEANGGCLPADVVALFANTGREMPATLDFVQRCSDEWRVPIVWLEFVSRSAGGFRVVSHYSASRNGEPFKALIAQKHMLPNPVMRFCTEELKIRTMERWVARTRGWAKYTEFIGLRVDEPRRLAKLRPGCVAPLAGAGVTKPDVLEFWKHQPFNLMLAGPWEGNCDGCFLKSRAARMRMLRDHPARMAWWSETEAVGAYADLDNPVMAQFLSRESWAGLSECVRRTPLLPFDETMHELGEFCDGCGT